MKLSPLGADLSPERFVCLPISVIDRLTEAVIDHHCHTTNAQAQATAHLIELVRQCMVSFGGETPEPRPLSTYYPYPQWKPAAERSAPRSGPTPTTEDVLRRLFAARRIPPHVFRELLSPPKETP